MKTLYFDFVDKESVYIECKQALHTKGIVLLRGFQFEQLLFEKFTKLFCHSFFRVTSRETYRLKAGDGFTTQSSSENFTLLGHSEVQYVPGIKSPDLGFFFCDIAPNVPGGETFLIDGKSMFRHLPKTLQNRFQCENITYEFLWGKERWEAQYNVKTEEQLHNLFQKIKNIKYTINDGWLHMFYTASAVIHTKDGSTVFSNAILAHLPSIEHPAYTGKQVYIKKTNQIYWENGEVFSRELISQLIDAHDQNKYLHTWEDKDLLIFDNFQYLHGREETMGLSERTILTRFGHYEMG